MEASFKGHKILQRICQRDAIILFVGRTSPALQEWLKVSYVCSQDRPLDFKTTTGMIKELNIKGINISKFDDYSILISMLGVKILT